MASSRLPSRSLDCDGECAVGNAMDAANSCGPCRTPPVRLVASINLQAASASPLSLKALRLQCESRHVEECMPGGRLPRPGGKDGNLASAGMTENRWALSLLPIGFQMFSLIHVLEECSNFSAICSRASCCDMAYASSRGSVNTDKWSPAAEAAPQPVCPQCVETGDMSDCREEASDARFATSPRRSASSGSARAQSDAEHVARGPPF